MDMVLRLPIDERSCLIIFATYVYLHVNCGSVSPMKPSGHHVVRYYYSSCFSKAVTTPSFHDELDASFERSGIDLSKSGIF